MAKKIHSFFFISVLFVSLSSCQFPEIQLFTISTPSQTSTSTLTFIPTASPTGTSTPTPSLTPTPTQTATPTALFYALANTPLPNNLVPINEARAGMVSCLTEIEVSNVTGIKWTPDKLNLAVASNNGISLFEKTNRDQVKFIETDDGLVSFDFSPDGMWLASAHELESSNQFHKGNFQIWAAPDYPRYAYFGDQRSVSSVSFLPGGNTLAIAYTSANQLENAVEFRNTFTWEITRTLQTGIVLDIAVSPSGTFIASVPDQYAVRIWDINKGTPLFTVDTSFTGAVNSIAFSPDGKILASGHYDGLIQLWDTSNGTLIDTYPSQGVIESLAFSPDGSVLAAGLSYEYFMIQLWSVSSGELLHQLGGHTHGVDYLIFSADGSLLVSASYDGTVRLWGIRP
jgi:WD40 repeat protein